MPDIFSSLDFGLSYMFTNNNFFKSIMLYMLCIMIMFMNMNYWMKPNYLKLIMYSVNHLMFMNSSKGNKKSLKGLSIMMSLLFSMIMVFNFQSMIPYSPSMTSHLIFTLPLGLTLWFSLILSNAIINLKKFIASFMPSGAPSWLSPFLILVDTMSISARPITLSFRLAANISTGHVILSLMGVYMSSYLFMYPISFPLFMSIKSLYILLEIGICLIQAYIFTLLTILYANEHN